MAVLKVEDDGPGFDPAVEKQLFERRVRGRESRGHGLAFVEAVVRVHGGRVQAVNPLAGGACLTLTLPLWKIESHVVSPPHPGKQLEADKMTSCGAVNF